MLIAGIVVVIALIWGGLWLIEAAFDAAYLDGDE